MYDPGLPPPRGMGPPPPMWCGAGGSPPPRVVLCGGPLVLGSPPFVVVPAYDRA